MPVDVTAKAHSIVAMTKDEGASSAECTSASPTHAWCPCRSSHTSSWALFAAIVAIRADVR